MKGVSVVITSYNQRAMLAEAVESVLDQSPAPAEVLICDDASTDDSAAFILRTEEENPGVVRGIARSGNVGIAANRSDGLRRAGGDFVTWLDGDDRFLPGKLQHESRLLEADETCGWAYSQVRHIGGAGEGLGLRYRTPPEGYILDDLVSMLGTAPRNPLVRRAALERTGLFNGDLELYEDFDFCLRLAAGFKAAYCPETLVEYRIHDGGLHCEDLPKHERALRRLQFHFSRTVSGLPADRRAFLETRLDERIAVVLEGAAEARRRG